MSSAVYEKLQKAYQSIQKKIPFVPRTALILGSGLGNFAERFDQEAVIDYHQIEGFPVSTVEGHKGRFIFSHIGGVPVVMMQGRVHYYEGYDMNEVVMPVRLMKLMGAEKLFLTNAAGGLNPDFAAGDFMMITDQISCFVPSPLIGANVNELGTRFPDMSHIYDPELQKILREEADRLQIPVKQGVYVQLTGPNFETPAEVRMCRLLGGDAVGMSTACEAVAANHMGLKICGISFISNPGCGLIESPLSHEEVQQAADQAAPKFEKLVEACIQRM